MIYQNDLFPRLVQSGFIYNPYVYLESSQDPFLAKHMYIRDDIASIAWESESAAIFAPVGGGKSALRLYTTRHAWQSPSRLPVTFLLKPSDFNSGNPSKSAQVGRLLRAITSALFVDTLIHPERFFDLPKRNQQRAASYFASFLPSTIDYYQDQIVDDGAFGGMVRDLEPSLDELPFPDAERVHELMDRLSRLQPTAAPLASSLDTFADIIAFLRVEVEYRSIFLLVDGVDGVEETVQYPQRAAEWLHPLLEIVGGPDLEGLFLKGFFPSAMTSFIAPSISAHIPRARHINILWDAQQLTEMLRRRVWAATDNLTDSLSSLAAPTLRDVERRIATFDGIPPLPREVIAFTHAIITAFAQRVGDSDGLLSEDDLAAGYQAYQLSAPPKELLCPS